LSSKGKGIFIPHCGLKKIKIYPLFLFTLNFIAHPLFKNLSSLADDFVKVIGGALLTFKV
jgi:hypothetical protein